MTEYQLLENADILYPGWILNARDLSPSARLLLGEVQFCCKHHGSFSLTNDEIANLYKVTNTTATLWVSELVEKGYVKREINMGTYVGRRKLTMLKGE